MTIFLETKSQIGYETSYFNYALSGHLPKWTSELALFYNLKLYLFMNVTQDLPSYEFFQLFQPFFQWLRFPCTLLSGLKGYFFSITSLKPAYLLNIQY